MAKAKNLKEVVKQFDSIAKCLTEQKNQIEIAALNAGMIPMLRRIYGDATGGGGVTIDGSSFGPYSTGYQNYVRNNPRKNRIGGSTRIKNLLLTGATRSSIQIGRSAGKNVIGFTDKSLAEIARFQESSDIQIHKPIFGFTETELQEVNNTLKSEIQIRLKECLK